jgi:hypothetical protein
MAKKQAGWLLEFRSKQRGGFNPAGLLMGPKPVILSFGLKHGKPDGLS